jgi:hypothetical protein
MAKYVEAEQAGYPDIMLEEGDVGTEVRFSQE